MFLRWLANWVGGGSVLLAVSLARAQCTKDADCAGDQICEAGGCMVPPPAATPAPAAPAASAPAALDPAPAASPAAKTRSFEPLFPADPPPRRHHSMGMMVGGIVMVSLAPVALIVAVDAISAQDDCERGPHSFDFNLHVVGDYANCEDYDPIIYGSFISAAALVGAGIPLIVIGAKKEPAHVRITPWATARSAGVGLRFDL